MSRPTMSEHFVEDVGVSRAWARALRAVNLPGQKELAPLTVAVTAQNDHDGVLAEEPLVRRELDELLESKGYASVDTVANTIFPWSLWNPDRPRRDLFDRYQRIVGRIRNHPNNRHGVYFDRMINNGPEGNRNQLDFGLTTYSDRAGVRRSVLQVATFDPHQDHSAAAMRGFPCLQHLSFVPTADGLSVNAFYATQYMVQRAYGNYLGIGRLGTFVAHELGLKLSRVTCHIGLAELDTPKRDVNSMMEVVNATLEQ